ncbi:MAG: 4-hydroxythreonine-4-phosphate dehydrogenase PdxA [Deltaproteobacteria bacterium]|nr:4-hydroxythreonine-4-phosphate dehydrogenase PdxA [Deltaproteobacteria bacterium]
MKRLVSLLSINPLIGETNLSNLPVIGITMGDPSGIGPEIILKALSDSEIYDICRPIVLGDSGAFSFEFGGLKKASINIISEPNEAKCLLSQIDLMAVSRLNKESMIPGKPTVEGGKAMVDYILRAVEMARHGEMAAMVTCPISKALMNEAGYHFEGHTQLISHLTNTDDYVMMLAGERLRVTLVTIHCALKDVPLLLNQDRIYKTITITSKALQDDFGIQRPRIAVAALNPHGGESGLFGSEDEEIIRPAIDKAMDEGYSVSGPLPADTLYPRAASGQFDAVVNMYHDQGLIPLKLLHFSDAVNVTLGLPIIRTSVDHGTAYDIAGKGDADPSSLKAAIRMAVSIAKNRRIG